MIETTATSGRGSIVTVEEHGQRREFAAADLPVTLGAAPAADVVLDGVAGSIQIGSLNEVFFVQPGRGARNLRLNGETLAGTRQLHDGDSIAFDRARLECRVAGGTLALKVDRIVTAGDTAPPDLDQLAQSRSRGADVAITPIAFKPTAARVTARRGVSRTTIGVATGFAVLAVVAWFAFTAKSVALDIEPTPATLSLPGTLFKLKTGDRFLLRSGTHRVEAALPGYYPLDTEFEVGSLSDQTICADVHEAAGIVTLTSGAEVGRACHCRWRDARYDTARRCRARARRSSARALGGPAPRGDPRDRRARRRRAPGAGRDADARLERRLVAHRPAGRHRARRRGRGRRHAGCTGRHVRRPRHRSSARGLQRVDDEGPRRGQSAAGAPDVTLAQADGRLEVASNPGEAVSASMASSAGARRCRCVLSRAVRIAWR